MATARSLRQKNGVETSAKPNEEKVLSSQELAVTVGRRCHSCYVWLKIQIVLLVLVGYLTPQTQPIPRGDCKSPIRAFLSHKRQVSFMAKIPSRKFSKIKKKVASREFPKLQSKIASRGSGMGTAKIVSRKTINEPAKAVKVPAASTRLARPINEQSREDRLAALRGRVKSLMPASDL